MTPEDGVMFFERMNGSGTAKQGTKCHPDPTPSKPAVSATRMKGAPIYGIRPIIGHEPGNVLLELTPKAAAVLRRVCGWIGGSSSGPRGQMNEIRTALMNAGIEFADIRVCGSIRID